MRPASASYGARAAAQLLADHRPPVRASGVVRPSVDVEADARLSRRLDRRQTVEQRVEVHSVPLPAEEGCKASASGCASGGRHVLARLVPRGEAGLMKAHQAAPRMLALALDVGGCDDPLAHDAELAGARTEPGNEALFRWQVAAIELFANGCADSIEVHGPHLCECGFCSPALLRTGCQRPARVTLATCLRKPCVRRFTRVQGGSRRVPSPCRRRPAARRCCGCVGWASAVPTSTSSRATSITGLRAPRSSA